MGVGDPLGLVEAVALGVDMFDCVLPTRLAATARSSPRRGGSTCATRRYADDAGPLDPACGCEVCARWSRGYLRHLLPVDEPTAPRLLTLHNVAWTLGLVERIRAAIGEGTLARSAPRWRSAGTCRSGPPGRMGGRRTAEGYLVRLPMEPLLILAVTFVLMWVLFILPQQRRVRAHQALVATLEAGDEVVTAAGIYGSIVDLDARR